MPLEPLAAASRRLFFIQKCCCAPAAGAVAARGVATAVTGASSSTGKKSAYGESPQTPYRYRPDGHPFTAHEGVTAEHALGVAQDIIKRCRNLAIMSTVGAPNASTFNGGGLTSRVVGVRFDSRDELGQPDLRSPGMTTNPQTRKASQLVADGRLTFTFLENASEGYVVLYANATLIRDTKALWDSRFTPAMAKRAEGIHPGGHDGGNFIGFEIEVERIELINHDVQDTGKRGERVIADHPIGWRPLALVRAEGSGGSESEVEAGVCCGWVLEPDDGRVMIK